MATSETNVLGPATEKRGHRTYEPYRKLTLESPPEPDVDDPRLGAVLFPHNRVQLSDPFGQFLGMVLLHEQEC